MQDNSTIAPGAGSLLQGWANQTAEQAASWLLAHAFTPTVAVQLLITLGILIVSAAIASLASMRRVVIAAPVAEIVVNASPAASGPQLVVEPSLRKMPMPARPSWAERNLAWLSARFTLTRRETLFLLLASGLLWIAASVAQTLGYPSSVLRICASLAIAWSMVRIGTSAIRSRLWSKLAAYGIWLAAALDILNLLQPLLTILDRVAFTIGTQRFSLLLILKGLVAFALLLWVAGLLGNLVNRATLRADSVTPSQKVMIQKVSRIVLFIIAMLLSLNVAGIDLTVLAVFSGAVGIGIGIGLQRIFANLVSGFILLFDKSIKPGDVISVGATYGWVNRLGARYVSILTRDGKEHLIPNEKLITDQVENWSYSDDKVRLHIPITVGYDADPHRVRELLLETAHLNPRILSSPKPVCLLTELGPNGLTFEVRVWIRDPVNGVTNVRSSFNFAIWDVFKQHGIRIPYAQQDVHLQLDARSLGLLKQAMEN